MGIIPVHRSPFQRPHDPLVCGIDYSTDCDGCRAIADHNSRRSQRAARRHRLRVELRPDAVRVARLLKVYGRPLAKRFVAAMASDIADIVMAVMEERRK
jgi:hypothetical protein